MLICCLSINRTAYGKQQYIPSRTYCDADSEPAAAAAALGDTYRRPTINIRILCFTCITASSWPTMPTNRQQSITINPAPLYLRTLWNYTNAVITNTTTIFYTRWYFIHRGLEISKVHICVWNGYNGDSETVNELARHTAAYYYYYYYYYYASGIHPRLWFSQCNNTATQRT